MKVPDEAVKQMGAKLTLTGDKWSLKMGDDTSAGTSKSDQTKKPMEIDITTTEGKNKDTVIKAIVEHKGDTMKACYDVSGKERPKEFATKDKPTYMLISMNAKRSNEPESEAVLLRFGQHNERESFPRYVPANKRHEDGVLRIVGKHAPGNDRVHSLAIDQ